MLVVFSELVLAAAELLRVQAIRRAHDPQFPIIGPHFTFVFPFEGGEREAVLAHVRQVAAEKPTLPFRLERAAAVRDALGPRSHVFLLPVEGEAAMRVLHGRLYAGPLAAMLRADIPFHPHVTVGTFERHEEAEALAVKLSETNIAGRLEALQVAEFDGRALREIERLPLS